jgi:hypothetical protein
VNLHYQWEKNGSTIGGDLDSYSSLSVTLADTGHYSVIVTGTCGTAYSDTVAVTVNGVTLISDPAGFTVCDGLNAAFDVSATGLGNLSYQWETDNGTGSSFTDIAGETSSLLQTPGLLGVNNGFNYRVVIKDDNLCPLTSASASLDVIYSPSSSSVSAGSDIITCNDGIVLTAIPAGGTWSIVTGSGTFADLSDDTTSVTGLGSFNEFVWTITNSCASTSDTVSVSMSSGSMLISAALSKDTTCAGQEITLTASATGGSGSYTYVALSLDGVTNKSSDNPVFSVAPGVSTDYVVFASDNNQAGCVSNYDTVNVFVTSAQVPMMANLITPNNDGKNDGLVIRDEHGVSMLDASSLTIYNRWGSTIFRSENYQNDFDASQLSDGVYYLYFKAGCGGKESKTWLHIIREIK